MLKVFLFLFKETVLSSRNLLEIILTRKDDSKQKLQVL